MTVSADSLRDASRDERYFSQEEAETLLQILDLLKVSKTANDKFRKGTLGMDEAKMITERLGEVLDLIDFGDEATTTEETTKSCDHSFDDDDEEDWDDDDYEDDDDLY